MKMYLKLFFWTAIPFGLAMGIFAGLAAGAGIGIMSGVSSGLFFGFFMSLVLGTVNALMTKKTASGIVTGPNQSATVELDLSIDLAFGKCVQALNQFGANIHSQDKVKSEINATTGATWKSFGEVLTVRLSSSENQKVKIEITSSPKLKTQLVDYGKGRDNVDKIAEILSIGNS